jgi:hypothetical protein
MTFPPSRATVGLPVVPLLAVGVGLLWIHPSARATLSQPPPASRGRSKTGYAPAIPCSPTARPPKSPTADGLYQLRSDANQVGNSQCACL